MVLLSLRQRYFANYMSGISEIYSKSLTEEKKTLFAKLKEQKSVIPEYKSKGSIRIVELGAGAGPNLEYYPKCNLTVVDPNQFFQDHFRASLAKCPDVTLDGYLEGYGENLEDLIADASVDAVVVTSVFCSIAEAQKVLKEIQRILVPGGKFYYIEHIQGRIGTWTYYLQKIMMGLQIWQFINCNCRVDRDLDYQITLAGFSNLDQRLFDIDRSKYIGFHFIAPHVTGIATK